MPDFSKIYLFRMTHIENVPHILQYGITHMHSPNANPKYAAMGDTSLISKRNFHYLDNGKKLGDYIPFYFGVCMPMLYVVQKGYNGVKAVAAENIIYCVLSINQIIKHKLDYVFTDGHAVDSFSTEYYPDDIDEIEKIIDKKAIDTQYWKNDKDLDLKRRKEAEFLVASDIPKSSILGFYVYNQKAKNTLMGFGIADKNIFVRPQNYF